MPRQSEKEFQPENVELRLPTGVRRKPNRQVADFEDLRFVLFCSLERFTHRLVFVPLTIFSLKTARLPFCLRASLSRIYWYIPCSIELVCL